MVIDEGFTQKEMLIRLLDKMDCIESKMDRKFGEIHKRVTQTNVLAEKTNGKVHLHTKMICGIVGAIITVAGWVIYLSIK